MVTNLIYIPDTPFGPGNDWSFIVQAPSGGSAMLSFDGGSSWIQSSTYNSTYGGFELKCQDGAGTQWGLGACMPINGTGTLTVKAKKLGDSTSKSFTVGQGEQVVGGDGFAFAYSAFCEGTNITLSLCAQYATSGANNYQLTEANTNKVRVSISGQFLTPMASYSDGCHVSTCHWTRVFQKITIPVSQFPLPAIFSDSTSVVAPWSTTIEQGEIGNPCQNAVVPVPPPVITATANPNTYSVETGSVLQMNVAQNDTLCSSGPSVFVVVRNPSSGVVSLSANGSGSYTPSEGFVGSDSFEYAIVCSGIVTSRATVTINVFTNDPCYGQTQLPSWALTGVEECINGLLHKQYRNMNPCYPGDDFKMEITGKCKKKVRCPKPGKCLEEQPCGCK